MQDVFLVTGASKGLGRSLALSIANSGCTVIALARESPELNSVEFELKKISQESFAIACDLSDSSHILDASEIIVSNFGHLSGIIHNAGIINPIGNMLDVEREGWERTIQVNLLGVQDLTRSLDSIIGGENHTRLLPFLVAQRSVLYTDGVRIVYLRQVLICGQSAWLRKGQMRTSQL